MRRFLALFALSPLALFAACGDGVGPASHLVGGLCSNDTQCSSRCYRSGDFGNGMCTVSCRLDADCPGGTACVQNSGNGICAVQCQAPKDCVGFGPEWTCAAEDRVGGGQALICRVP